MTRFSSSIKESGKSNKLSVKGANHKSTVRKQKKNITSLLKKQLMTLDPASQGLSNLRKTIMIFRAVEEGDLQMVKTLIQQTGPSIRKAKSGCTLLHVAAANNHLEIVDFLLQYISPNVVNKDGQTPAHLAAMEGYTEVLKILLADDEVNPDLQDTWQRTYKDWLAAPLFEAILVGNGYQTKELLDLGANPDYHAGSSVECVLGRELSVTTARQLAVSLEDERIIDMLPKADCLQNTISIDQDGFSYLVDEHKMEDV